MAKSATKSEGGSKKKASGSTKSAPRKAVAVRSTTSESADENGAADMLVKLLQSPIVADLLAVAATAAVAALAEHGFSSRGTSSAAGGKRAGKAVKEAGKAAAAAIGRRLANEVEEIRAAAKAKSSGAEA